MTSDVEMTNPATDVNTSPDVVANEQALPQPSSNDNSAITPTLGPAFVKTRKSGTYVSGGTNHQIEWLEAAEKAAMSEAPASKKPKLESDTHAEEDINAAKERHCGEHHAVTPHVGTVDKESSHEDSEADSAIAIDDVSAEPAILEPPRTPSPTKASILQHAIAVTAAQKAPKRPHCSVPRLVKRGLSATSLSRSTAATAMTGRAHFFNSDEDYEAQYCLTRRAEMANAAEIPRTTFQFS